MEVMGLMLGEFVDDYTVRVVDVFAMPQSGTSVSVESVDPVFQTKMLEFMQQTNRPEMVVGWYHSHPGFGCWLSGTDVNTQQSFEQLNQRAVAVVVDPIQSVKGKVVLDAFRLINPQLMMMGQEPRQTTSLIGHLNKPSIQALIHGLNRHYYSIAATYRKNDLELKMLMNLKKKQWMHGFQVDDMYKHAKSNEETMETFLDLSKKLQQRLKDEESLSETQRKVAHVGKVDPRKRLERKIDETLKSNIVQMLGSMVNTMVF
jgi:26S proteasome regulatory subunit N11